MNVSIQEHLLSLATIERYFFIMQTTVVVGIYPFWFVLGTLTLVAISVALTFSKDNYGRDYLVWAVARVPFFGIAWPFLHLFLHTVFYPGITGMSIFDTNLLLAFLSFLFIVSLLLLTEAVIDALGIPPLWFAAGILFFVTIFAAIILSRANSYRPYLFWVIARAPSCTTASNSPCLAA